MNRFDERALASVDARPVLLRRKESTGAEAGVACCCPAGPNLSAIRRDGHSVSHPTPQGSGSALGKGIQATGIAVKRLRSSTLGCASIT